MIQRELKDKLLEMYRYFPIVSLNGPRQSGKTTLLKDTFKDLPYVSLEDPDIRLQAETDPRTFLSNYPTGAIFDEVQRVPSLFSYLQTLVDGNKELKFILSGSQNFLLNQNISQSLAGRVGVLTLLPLSFEELKGSGIVATELNELLYKGFYPALFDRDVPPHLYYPSYLQTYIERDVRLIKNIENESLFIKFIKLCAGRAGQLINITNLAADTGITANTAKAWLSVLETSYVAFQLQPWHTNYNKRLIKTPKLYFYDTGLLCYLLNIEKPSQLSTYHGIGNLFENFVVVELLKKRLNAAKTSNLYFWRNKGDMEIDVVIEKANAPSLVEIKAGKTQLPDYFANLNKWPGEDAEKFVVYGGEENCQMQHGKLISWKNIDAFENE